MARAAKLDLRQVQQELATRLASKTAAQVESARLGVACAGEQWLVRLADAAEVLAVPPITTVPLTKPWFSGVANIRGNLYAVVDFARFMGVETTAAAAGNPNARLLLLGPRAGDLRAGIVVERVLGLRNLGELAPASPAANAPSWHGPRWSDASGTEWQEIDLAQLAQDPAFLTVGL